MQFRLRLPEITMITATAREALSLMERLAEAQKRRLEITHLLGGAAISVEELQSIARTEGPPVIAVETAPSANVHPAARAAALEPEARLAIAFPE